MPENKQTAGTLHAECIGIGVGPGDPELLTLRAVRELAEADLIYTPAARIKEQSLAAQIARGAGLDAAKVRELVFPMERDPEVLSEAWRIAAEPVAASLDQGLRVAFLTLGDPSVYSTWIYLRRALESRRPGTRFAVVPGIMAANAAAARLGVPLTEGSERLVLLPLPDPVEKLDAYLSLTERLVIYKIAGRLGELATWTLGRGLEKNAHLVVGVGLDRERAGLLADLAPSVDGYLSVAVIKTGGSL